MGSSEVLQESSATHSRLAGNGLALVPVGLDQAQFTARQNSQVAVLEVASANAIDNSQQSASPASVAASL